MEEIDLKVIFNELQKSNEPFVARLVDYKLENNNPYKLYVGLSRKGNSTERNIVIATENVSKSSERKIAYINKQNGFSLDLKPNKEETLKVNCIITIENQKDLDEIFFSFFNDVLNKIKQEDKPAIDIIIERINSWIKYFKIRSERGLSPEKLKGLYAELLFLRTCLQNESQFDLSKNEIIKGWEGPLRENIDFIFPGFLGFEIKCTSKNNPFEVTINNEYQLDNSNLDELYLLVYQVKQHKNNDYPSLLDLIDEIKSLLSNDINELNEFDELLWEAGYLEEHNENYEEISFEIISRTFYEVSDTFPKITKNDINNEISKVEYQIDIQNQIKHDLRFNV
tara:strand:- start:531 stop:1547 length:1017 start_codon:yes stop_codon:yes gene_type:complete